MGSLPRDRKQQGCLVSYPWAIYGVVGPLQRTKGGCGTFWSSLVRSVTVIAPHWLRPPRIVFVPGPDEPWMLCPGSGYSSRRHAGCLRERPAMAEFAPLVRASQSRTARSGHLSESAWRFPNRLASYINVPPPAPIPPIHKAPCHLRTLRSASVRQLPTESSPLLGPRQCTAPQSSRSYIARPALPDSPTFLSIKGSGARLQPPRSTLDPSPPILVSNHQMQHVHAPNTDPLPIAAPSCVRSTRKPARWTPYGSRSAPPVTRRDSLPLRTSPAPEYPLPLSPELTPATDPSTGPKSHPVTVEEIPDNTTCGEQPVDTDHEKGQQNVSNPKNAKKYECTDDFIG
jgi:hypothetical protein